MRMSLCFEAGRGGNHGLNMRAEEAEGCEKLK